MSILDKLNERQKEAALTVDGPVLILAGAGTGKTRTITYRIAHMVEERGISPYKILAVTFTNKAAKEMKERVEDLIGEDGKKIMISTFHSFALRLLRIYGDRLGYNPNFTIYDTDDQKRVIKNILKKLGREKEEIKNIVSKISSSKEEGLTPKDLEYNPVFADIFREYNAVLKENNAMDFSDILLNAYNLLELPDILAKVQEKFIYIMVDEYQDTNNIQYNIVNKIAQKYKNICVVGDENQSIYGFRGANIQNILDFEKDYSDAKVIKLEENYRSTNIILDAANAVIKNNESSKEKNLWSNKSSKELITVKECEDARDEAGYVIKEILKGITKGKRYKEFTILYRTNAQSRLFEEKLLRENIPYKIFGGVQFYQRAEIKDVLGYLAVINNQQDTLNLNRIINIPKRKIGEKTIEKIGEFARESGYSFFEALKQVENVVGLSSTVKATLTEFINMMVGFIEETTQISVSELFSELVEKIGYKNYLQTNYEDYEGRIENIDELYNSIVEIERLIPNLTLREYLENVSLMSATDNLEEEKDYVKLMTLHNSKGLEFPTVFLVGVEEGLFPGSRADLVNSELEEERRLCYVGITRAEDKLYITHALKRQVYGGDWDAIRESSRFIDEIPSELVERLGRIVERSEIPVKKHSFDNTMFKKMITIEDLNKTAKNFPYSKGEKVMHKKFGLGIVQNVTEKKVEIKFIDGSKEIALVVADKFLTKV